MKKMIVGFAVATLALTGCPAPKKTGAKSDSAATKSDSAAKTGEAAKSDSAATSQPAEDAKSE